MKYLVNRETKEHRIADSETVMILEVHASASGGPDPDLVYLASGAWDVVEADAEGWIKWDQSKECPVRKGVECELLVISTLVVSTSPQDYEWRKVKAYRPILDKPEVVDDTPYPVGDIISRLKSAHEAAQSIPDLLAELREVLGSMGYDVVARSPFVERPESNWFDSWEVGDTLSCIKEVRDFNDAGKIMFAVSDRCVIVEKSLAELIIVSDASGRQIWVNPNHFERYVEPEPDMTNWRGDLIECAVNRFDLTKGAIYTRREKDK